MKNRLSTFLRAMMVSFGFIGYFPVASGTVGTAGALVTILILWKVLPNPHYAWVTALLAVVLTILGILLGPWAVKHYKSGDPKPFVLDEAAAFFLAVGIQPKPIDCVAIILAFFIFRFLDILKPFPAGRAEKLPHGFGIMLDDTIVGIYTYIILRIALLL